MARPREVRDTFITLISQNGDARAEVETALAATAEKRTEANDYLTSAIEKIARTMIEPLDRDGLAMLAKISGGNDVAVALDTARVAREEAKKSYDAYVEARGGGDAIRNAAYEAKKTFEGLDFLLQEKSEYLSGKSADLALAIAFHGKYPGKRGIDTEEGVAYFNSKKGIGHYWAMAFNSHYRNGRNLVADYETRNRPLPKAWQDRDVLAVEVAELTTKHASAKSRHESAELTASEASRMARLVMEDADILAVMERTITGFLKDKETFDRAAVMLPRYVDDLLVQAWVKADAFTKMEERLKGQAQALRNASAALEKPMSKLDKAVRRNVTKDIRVDLPDISKKMHGLQVVSRHLATEVGKAGNQIERFGVRMPRNQMKASNANLPNIAGPRAVDISATDIVMMWMIHDMLTPDASMAAGVDAAALHMTLGIDDKMADTIGVNLDNLTSQLDAATLQGIDSLNLDITSLDNLVQNIDVSVPDMSSLSNMDISVPDVQVSVDTSSFDSGGSFGGGFD